MELKELQLIITSVRESRYYGNPICIELLDFRRNDINKQSDIINCN